MCFFFPGFAFIKMVDKWIYFLHYHDSTSKNVCRTINYEKRISLNADSYTMGLVLEDFPRTPLLFEQKIM